MNVEKSVQKIIDTVVKDITNGKYVLIEIGKHNSKIKYGSSILKVWQVSGVECCRIDESVNGLKFPEFDEDFKKILYKLATTKTKHVLRNELTEANKERKKLYLEYKESVQVCKKISEELKTFTI